MPAGVEASASAPAAGFLSFSIASSSGPYGFQNFPPVTSNISTLYDWYRSSTVPTRAISAGARVSEDAGLLPAVVFDVPFIPDWQATAIRATTLTSVQNVIW